MPKLDPLLARRTCIALVGLALVSSACVSTSVTSRPLQKGAAPVERVFVVVQAGKFSANNTASSLGQKNLDALVPSLVERVPAVFALNGVPARAVVAGAQPLQAQPAEHLLLITPTSATYNSKSGQELFVRAELREPSKAMPMWQADVRMATLGFGKFDQKVADDFSLQLLEKLRGDGMARIAEGPLRKQ